MDQIIAAVVLVAMTIAYVPGKIINWTKRKH